MIDCCIWNLPWIKIDNWQKPIWPKWEIYNNELQSTVNRLSIFCCCWFRAFDICRQTACQLILKTNKTTYCVDYIYYLVAFGDACLYVCVRSKCTTKRFLRYLHWCHWTGTNAYCSNVILFNLKECVGVVYQASFR